MQDETGVAVSHDFRIGVMVPQFPEQTHIAVWRLVRAMRRLGASVTVLSTRRATNHSCRHAELLEAAKSCIYLWPAHLTLIAPFCVKNPAAVFRMLLYIIRLAEGGIKEKLRVLRLVIPAIQLAAECRARGIGQLFVHSCADAAHVTAMANRAIGIPYSLRLGGDLEVYGINHNSKMQRAVFILAAAENNENQILREVAVPEERVDWSWFGVETDRFCPPAARDWSETPLRLITVARLNHAKGHEIALQALAIAKSHNRQIHYTIVGDGPSRQALFQLVTELGLTSNVELCGALGEDDVVLRLQSSHLFVLPTNGIGEGSPMAVLEAMSTGLPCICTDVGGIRNIVEDGRTGFVLPPGDVKSLADCILAVDQDRVTLAAMAENARQTAVSEFGVEQVAEKILARFRGR